MRPRPSRPARSQPRGLHAGERSGRLARSTAFFSIATAASRVAGLAREIVAASYFGIKGPMSAFTVAFQVPNLVRSLFADAALQPAFVPIFTEQLEKGNHKEAFRLASTMLFVVTLVLGAITAALRPAGAGCVMPVFAPGLKGEIRDLMIVLSQLLFPILILLGVTGLVVGILNSYDRFGAFAISPLFWNLTIIAVLVALAPAFSGDDQIYAYAIGILVGTVVQLAIPACDLRNTPFRVRAAGSAAVAEPGRAPGPAADAAGDDQPRADQLQPAHQQLLRQPRLATAAPAAIDKAFRIYSCRRGSSRSRSRPSSSRPSPGSPPAGSTTTCARRWPTGCARSSSCCCPPRPRSSSSRSR